MNFVVAILNRYPWQIVAAVVAGLAIGAWWTTDFVETTVRPRQQEAIQNKIAELMNYADHRFAGDKFDVALDEYRYVLTGFGDHLTADQIGLLQQQVGRSLVGLAAKREPVANLTAAIQVYDRALEIRQMDAAPAAYAETQRYRGRAYLRLAGFAAPDTNITNAVAAFEQALQAEPPESNPLGYADSRRLLGNAHRDRSALNSSADLMDETIGHYKAALEMVAPDTDPEAFGTILTDMAQAYAVFASYSYKERYLNEAVELYKRALRLFPPENFPRHYGRTHKLMGDAYTALTTIKSRSRTNRTTHNQKVYRWGINAQQAYETAAIFGFSQNDGMVQGSQGAVVDYDKEVEETSANADQSTGVDAVDAAPVDDKKE